MIALTEPNMDRLTHPQTVGNSGNNPNMDKPIRKVLADNLSALMASNPRFKSNQKLAAATKLGLGTITRVLNQDSAASIETVEAIAKRFGLTVSQLLNEELFGPKSSHAVGEQHAHYNPAANDDEFERMINTARDAFHRGSLPPATISGFEQLFRSLHIGPPTDVEHEDTTPDQQAASLLATLDKGRKGPK